jgi:hypothetical protein
MANRWISQNNFITSTNIRQLQSDFTIPKIERVVNKKTGRIPLKILDFDPTPYVVLRFIGHPYRRALRQAVSPSPAPAWNGKNRALFFAFWAWPC